MKNSSIITPSIIVFIVLAIYLPFFAHFLNLSKAEPNSQFPIYGESDSLQYAKLSDNLISHRLFSLDGEPPYNPETFRTPGYPAILAIFKIFFGSYKFFPLLQILLVAVTAILIFKIGQHLVSQTVGFAAAILYAIDPANIFHSLIILSDIIFVFLLVLCVYLLFFANYKKRYVIEGAAGALLGFATLVRPISMFLVAVFVLFYFLIKKNQMEMKKIFIGLLVFILCYSLFFVPWTIRNKAVSGVWGLSSIKSYTLFYYYLPEYLSLKYGQTPETMRSRLRAETGIENLQSSSLKNSAALDKVSFGYLKEDMFGYTKFHILKTIPFFLTSSAKTLFARYQNIKQVNLTNFLFKGQFGNFFDALKKQPPGMTFEEIFWLAASILAFGSIFYKKHRIYILLFLAIIFYFAVLTGPLAYARLRLPVTPFMFLLVCLSLAALKDFFKARLKSKNFI